MRFRKQHELVVDQAWPWSKAVKEAGQNHLETLSLPPAAMASHSFLFSIWILRLHYLWSGGYLSLGPGSWESIRVDIAGKLLK